MIAPLMAIFLIKYVKSFIAEIIEIYKHIKYKIFFLLFINV